MDYNHETMFDGVKNVWCDGGGCHWCGRDTRDPMKGHDGFCPVPAMFALEAELAGALKEIELRDEGKATTLLLDTLIKKGWLSPEKAARLSQPCEVEHGR